MNKKLYCPVCKEIRYSSTGSGATIKINGKVADMEIIGKAMKCNKCGSTLSEKK